MPTLATNKKAMHDYNILETLEAGFVLTGPEVKATKLGHINLKGSYVSLDQKGMAWLVNAHISSYAPAAGQQLKYDPDRRRKLLLHAKETSSLIGKNKQAGLTIVPLSVYTKGGLIKVKLGIARGKTKADKRETLKKRDVDREIRSRMKSL